MLVRHRRRRRPLRAQPLIHLVPNIFTVMSLCAGLTAIRYGLDQRFELALTLILGVSLVVTKGFAAAETDQVFRRAWQLCGRCPDSAAAFKVLRLIGLSQMFRGEIQAARETGERLTSGTTGQMIWTFNRVGDFEFACLIPGHYQSGMVGKIKVFK